MVSAETIDAYFGEKDFFPHITYEPIGELIIEEAKLASLGLALACALVEQESGGKNLFGADFGSILAHRPVDAQGVGDLLRFVSYGGPSNGVGLTQLTYPPLIKEAEALGGAYLPRYQLRAGFRVLRDYLGRYPLRQAIGAYNRGPSNPNYDYAASVLTRRDEWRVRLA
jgi:hypothetical protein